MEPPQLLPMTMQIAAKTVALDRIKIVVDSDKYTYDKSNNIKIRTICFRGWEKRLINKAVERLTNDINNALKDGETRLIPHMLSSKISLKTIFISVNMNYEFRRNDRIEKLDKIMNKIKS